MKLFTTLSVVICLNLIGPDKGLFAQDPPYNKVNIASPTAASLGRFGDIPVNNHTGIPNISIPLHTIKEGPLTLPISLSYHAGGVKTMDPAGWVGTNFSLNAGGVISRSVRGLPDGAMSGHVEKNYFKNYGYNNYLTGPQTPGCSPDTVRTYHQDFANGTYDGEPDLFSFNFSGFSGKFFFSDDRTPVIVDGQDIKVEYNYPADLGGPVTTYTSNIMGFKLTVSNGDIYYFGVNPGINTAGVDAVETSFPLSTEETAVTDQVFSSWYLTKIKSADGNFEINFSYVSEKYSFYTLSMFPVDENPAEPIDEYRLVKMYIEGVSLDAITFSGGTVNFIGAPTPRTDLSNRYADGSNILLDLPNVEAKALSAITMQSSAGICKTYSFFYSYFSDLNSPLTGRNFPSLNSDKYRLKLDSLREQSCDNVVILPPHKFEYYTNFLPRRLSFAQDHWGFYNGKTNYSLIPTYTERVYWLHQGADRDPSWPEMKNGALNKIIYPTGGYTLLDFEANNTWVNTARFTRVTVPGEYTAGYGGHSTMPFPGVHLSGNHYQVTLSNTPCGQGLSGCTASINITGPNGTYSAVAVAEGGQTVTKVFNVVPGQYTITVFRNNPHISSSGARAIFTEIIPTQVQENVLVGGLRIKQITKNDGSVGSSNIVTNYDYTDDNGKSTSTLYSRPRYVQVIRNDLIAKVGMGYECSDETVNTSSQGCVTPDAHPRKSAIKSPSPIVPMATTQGNHIGYNQVKVSQQGNGYSIYRYYGSGIFENIQSDVAVRELDNSVCSPLTPSFPSVPVPYEYKRGMLSYEGHYKENGSRVQESHYFYEFDSSRISTPAIISTISPANTYATYSMRSYWKKRTSTMRLDFDDNGISNTAFDTTFYESSYHHLPTRQTRLNSVGELVSNKYKYAADYRLSSCDAIDNGETTYLQACQSCKIAFNNRLASCTLVKCKVHTYVAYDVCLAKARIAYVNTRRSAYTNPVNNFASCISNGTLTADVTFKPILLLQLQFRNPVLESTVWSNDLLLAASFNQFSIPGSSTVSNLAAVNQLRVASPINNFATSTVNSGSQGIATDSRYSSDVLLSYISGNIATVTSRSGVPMSYIWGYGNTMPIAKVENALNSEIAHTSFENGASENGWIITSGYFDNSQSFTGATSFGFQSGTTITTTLQSTKQYSFSYWGKHSPLAVTVNGSQIQPQRSSPTRNGWTYYEYVLPSNVSSLHLSSNSAIVDELRLYPKDAFMTTYTYLPGTGVSSECDINNNVTYYEYDSIGRLKVVRDKNKGIIKTIQYNYRDQ